MTDIYAVRLPVGDTHRLGSLRTVVGLEVLEEPPWLWLRGSTSNETLKRALQGLPGKSYRVLADGQLCEPGSRVPLGFLPRGEWGNLAQWVDVELPASSLSGEVREDIQLRLVASADVREPNLVLTSQRNWSSYGVEAPQVRLDRWHFAVSSAGEVLIRGLPLPPLPGIRLVESCGIAVPCGWSWCPAVDANTLAAQFGLKSHDVLLWLDRERRERVSAEMFVRATHSSIRNSTPQL